MKRANGSGSIKKLSGKRRKPFAVLITVGYTDEGKQLQNPIGYFAKRVEAEAFLADYLRDPTIVRPTPIFADLYAEMMTRLERKGRSDATLKMYRDTYPYFSAYHDKPITALRTADINRIIQHHIARGDSYSLLSKIRVLASQVLKIAMEEDHVNKNYASLVTLPPKPVPDKEIFTPAEVDRLFALARTDDTAKIICIMIYTMTRPGELLTISKFKVFPDLRYLIGGIKTAAGRDRIIPLHKRILPFIDHFMAQKSEHLISRDGAPLKYRHFSTLYYQALETAQVKPLPPMRCRKTGLTRLKNSGADDMHLKRIAGHADISVTDENYIANEVEPLIKAVDGMA